MATPSSDPSRDDALTEPRLDGPSMDGAPPDISDPDAAVVSYAPAERYEERATLGSGGMGEVRLCRDRAIGREVALKVLHPSRATQGELRERFVREARVQAQLEHPAIVPVYDFGVDAEGLAYFTMKRVRGVTLEEIIDGLRRNDAETLRQYGRHRLLAAFVQVCRAIDYAHERGVLHRDLKPANIMLGGYGEVYVLDWGLARVRSASRNLDAALGGEPIDVEVGENGQTAAGAVFGTPAYMAPEQIRGELLDERADVYALGGILFEMLTLEPLHGVGSAGAMLGRALKGVDSRPASRNPSIPVPPELEVSCIHACALDRKDRFASARELAEAIESYLSGDRDLELRRELAAVHLVRAREAASRAFVPGAPTEERRAALAEAGRAVALAPEDPDSRAVLVDLLTRPPKRAPPEVLAAMEAESFDSHMKMLPRATLTLLLPWLFVLPALALIGVRDVRLVALVGAPWCAVAAYVWLTHRFGSTSVMRQRAFAIVLAVVVASCSVFYGPMIIVPSLAVVMTLAMALHQREENQPFVMLSMALAIIVPTLLALFDVLPVRHQAGPGGALVLLPGALDFSPTSALLAAAGMHVLVIVAGTRYAVNFRRTMSELSLANRLQSWQLTHLVPRDAVAAMDSLRPPPGSSSSRA
jgi:serine/threonine-protein kinase